MNQRGRSEHTPNNVPVPMSVSEGFLYRLGQLRIGTRGNLRASPQSGGKTQSMSLSLYSGPQPDNEPVTLFLGQKRLWANSGISLA
ncbi:MAG: hypothetical protein GX456_17685 [Verrucomicrobia bacterium]|nr:hypothetical protein [Verrucomicrobiota bacterium]